MEVEEVRERKLKAWLYELLARAETEVIEECFKTESHGDKEVTLKVTFKKS